jgi:hypothetical protein
MRKIKEIIRLKFGVGLSLRAIQQSLNVSYGTVSNYIRRAEQAGLGWPLPPDIDEPTLGDCCSRVPAPKVIKALLSLIMYRSIRS